MHHMAKSAVCPFFLNAVNYSVHCEGFKDGNSLRICFNNKEEMDKHSTVYCKNIHTYTHCPIYELILIKYKGEDRDE